jgi:hypothetical protein
MILPTAGICPANTITCIAFQQPIHANHRYMTDNDATTWWQGWLAKRRSHFVVMCAS